MSLVDFLSEIDSLDKSNTYFLYCRSGKRCPQACMYMYDKGFTTYNLMGGMLSWDGEVVKWLCPKKNIGIIFIPLKA